MNQPWNLVHPLFHFDWSSLQNYFNSLKGWQKVGVLIGGTVIGTLISYGTYFWYNYRELFVLRGYKPHSSDFVYNANNNELRVRVINLDGALELQKTLIEKYKPQIIEMKDWGPYMRLDCSFRMLWSFERELTRAIGSQTDDDADRRPLITFYGSNDFHHVALSLVRRFRTPFNLVIFDNHPDWFKYYPGMHCGCWFSQAAALPTCQQAIHFGGCSGEFTDNWGFHPWKELISGKIAVFPTQEKWQGLHWDKVKHHQVINLGRPGHDPVEEIRIRELLEPFREVLSKYPLYITLDKDCIFWRQNFQNWNSGFLKRTEVILIIKILIEMSGGNLLAIDVTGDFTKVNVHGMYRNYLHKTGHDDEQNNQSPQRALVTNQDTNLALMQMLTEELIKPRMG